LRASAAPTSNSTQTSSAAGFTAVSLMSVAPMTPQSRRLTNRRFLLKTDHRAEVEVEPDRQYAIPTACPNVAGSFSIFNMASATSARETE
jgi:hypothetical protein